ncbi:macro domain-containing protein [Liberiplasma polymorphum]|uniref:macro domain-containing protein n=1 Tax=Liberiplasma polymorphum TaxID=3374570 RepID=UPI003771E14B
MPIIIKSTDVLTLKVDAIVNSVNQEGLVVDSIDYSHVGCYLLEEIKQKSKIIVTKNTQNEASLLKYYAIIHVVVPSNETGTLISKQLEKSYLSILNTADESNIKSIAIPILNSESNPIQKSTALKIAYDTVRSFLITHDMLIYIVVSDIELDAINKELFHSVQDYINKNLETESLILAYESINYSKSHFKKADDIDDIVSKIDETFTESLLNHIDKLNKKDSEIYKKANIDRKLFSKIRSNKDYQPSKQTALAFAIALELSKDQTNDLISKAGYALSNSQISDLIILYFLEHKNYNIDEINATLFAYNQKILS